jgi:preprotein translocase subunit SecG
MLKLVQLCIGLILIVLIVPQTPTENIVLRKFSETGFFTSYKEAKNVLNISTWGLILAFLLITFSLNFIN